MARFRTIIALVLVSVSFINGHTPDEDECAACVSTIEIFDVLSSERFETVKNLCDQLETESNRKICRQTVAGLENKSPRDICILIRQCSEPGDNSEELVFTSEIGTVEDPVTDVNVKGSIVCSICKIAVGFIQQYISNPHSEQIILRMLRMVCRFIPFMRSTCYALVREYGPLLIHLAKQFLKPGICHSWFHCPALTEGPMPEEKECRACVSTVETLDVLSPKMFETVNNICDQLETESNRKICRNTAASLKNKSPRDICLTIGKCSEPADNSDDLGEMSELVAVEDKVTDVNVKGSIVCTVCKLAVGFIQRYISNPHSEQIILRMLRMVCRFIPFMRSTCYALVNEYGPLLIHLAKQFLKPGICHSWFHCPALTTTQDLKQSCRLCRFGMGVLIDTIRDPALDTRLRLYTLDFCANTINDYQCASAANKLTKFLKRLAADLRHASFLKGMCQTIDVCPAGEVLLEA